MEIATVAAADIARQLFRFVAYSNFKNGNCSIYLRHPTINEAKPRFFHDTDDCHHQLLCFVALRTSKRTSKTETARSVYGIGQHINNEHKLLVR